MQWRILNDSSDLSLLQRLFAVRNIQDHPDDFLSPSYARYRQPASEFDGMLDATQRIIQAMQRQEKIMIFGDYDVDGIVSSFTLYTFFRSFLNYPHVSIRLPHRQNDGYGIQTKHMDLIKEAGVSLIITVDNGITAIEPARHAKELGLDMIITDHHKPLEILPDALTIINPHLTPKLRFKELCGTTVAYKLCTQLAAQLITDPAQKIRMQERLLPLVAIATVADCMPLVDENRLLVSKWLEIINTKRDKMIPSLAQFINHLNIKTAEAYHIGFMIAPRLNATGRMGSAHDGLDCLLTQDIVKQLQLLQNMEERNTERKSIQDDLYQSALSQIDTDNNFLAAVSDEFHEGVIGIVAGKIAEKWKKPTLVGAIDKEAGTMVASLRGPKGFHIVHMLQDAQHLLLRFGGHAQAGGLTVALDKLDDLLSHLQTYCRTNFSSDDELTVTVDTKIHAHELDHKSMADIHLLGPFGEWNPEPTFLIDRLIITQASKIGTKGAGHLKLQAKHGNAPVTIMQRWKGDLHNAIAKDTPTTLIWRVKKDTYKGGFYMEGMHIVQGEE